MTDHEQFDFQEAMRLRRAGWAVKRREWETKYFEFGDDQEPLSLTVDDISATDWVLAEEPRDE